MDVNLSRIGFAWLLLTMLPHSVATAADETDFSPEQHMEMAGEALAAGEFLAAARHYREASENSNNIETAQKATRLAFSYGFDEETLKSASRWLELEPNSDEALLYTAQMQMRLGYSRDARRNFKRLMKKDGGDADQRLLSLVQVLAEEDPKESFELMQYLAKPYKKSAYANYAVAVMAIGAEETSVARERAEKAVELDPDWMKAKLLYARTLLLDGEAEKAIDYTARLIGDSADPDPDARLELALMMMSVGRNDDALSQVNQVLLEQPSRADALRLMAIINFRERRLDAAWNDFEDLLATRRYTNDALFYLAQISEFRQETDKAIRLYSGVQSGSNALAAQRRASVLRALRKDEPEEALGQLDGFARANPAYAVDIVLARARLLVELDRYDEALADFDRYVDFRPDDEFAMLGRAELLLRMDRLDDAIAQYRAAAERWPESATSLNALGYTLADRTTEYKEAEKLISKALAYEPNNPAIIDSMGWVNFRLGKNEEALKDLQRAYAAFDDSEVAAHIVEVLHALDRQDEALEMLLMAEEKDPGNKLLDDVRKRLFPEPD